MVNFDKYCKTTNELFESVHHLAVETRTSLEHSRDQENRSGTADTELSVIQVLPNQGPSASLLTAWEFINSDQYVDFQAEFADTGFSVHTEIEPQVGAFTESRLAEKVDYLNHPGDIPKITYENPDCYLLVVVEKLKAEKAA